MKCSQMQQRHKSIKSNFCFTSSGGTNVSTNRRKRKRVQESNRVPSSSDLGISTNQIPVMVSAVGVKSGCTCPIIVPSHFGCLLHLKDGEAEMKRSSVQDPHRNRNRINWSASQAPECCAETLFWLFNSGAEGQVVETLI